MKVAIYSRVYESDQKEDIQRLLQELEANNIQAVIYRGFFEQIILRSRAAFISFVRRSG
jgi:predicted site-specific integrase-resolvase